MAAFSNIKVKDSTFVDKEKCVICREDFRAPKLLPCQHSFCTSCLKTHIPDAKIHHFCCPTCNLKVPLSSEGVESLPKNYLSSILAAKDTLPSTKGECLHCQIKGKTCSVDFQCLDCEDAFCKQCQASHKLSSATRHHRLVPVQDLQGRNQFSCKKHSDGTRQLMHKTYCRKCESLHCEECMKNYEDHVLISEDKWKSLHKEKLDIFDKEVDTLLSNLEQQNNIIGVFKRVEKRIDEQKTVIDNEIYHKAKEIQELVEKVKNKKLALVQEHFDKELQKCKMLLQEERNHLKRLESTVSFVEDFMKHSTEGEYLMYEDDVKGRMSEYMAEREKFEIRTQHLVIKGEPTKELEHSLEEVIGQFESRERITDISGCEFGKLNPVVKGKIKLRCNANGIAVAENGDIIAVGGSKIEILSKDGQSKKLIECKELKNAWSVAVKYDLIFVSDSGYGSKEVLVLDFDGNCKGTIKMQEWLQHSYDYYGLGVAVGEGGIIFISCVKSSAIYTCTLDDTKLQLFISKHHQPGLLKPHNLSITPQGHLVVAMEDNKMIQVYNDQAELLWEFKNDNVCFGVCGDREKHIFIGSNVYSNKIHVVRDGVLKGTIEIPGVSKIKGLSASTGGSLLASHETDEITEVTVWAGVGLPEGTRDCMKLSNYKV